MKWDNKGNEYSPNIVSVETIDPNPHPEPENKYAFPKIIPVEYNSDDYYSGDSDWDCMIAIQGNFIYLILIGESRELEKPLHQKKEITVNYPKVNIKVSENAFKHQESSNKEMSQAPRSKIKSPKKQGKFKQKSNKVRSYFLNKVYWSLT